MSIIVASGEAISKNILNSSRSKQMYSFSKTKRFYNSDSIGSATFYYNLPSVKSKRATSIGYGSKSDFTKERNTNPPFYNLERLFEGKKKGEAPAYTIGLGREYFKKTVVNNTLSEPQYISPGPGKYNKMVEFGSDSPKYTIPKKSNRVTCLNKLGRTPGPGQYSCVNILGKYYDSRLKNAPMIGWGLSKSPRFIKHLNETPGPSTYKPETLINGKGVIYNSKYISSLGKSFIGKYQGYRETYLDDPGPGAYQAFSEFGIYKAKNADDFDKKLSTRHISEGVYQNSIAKSASTGNIVHTTKN